MGDAGEEAGTASRHGKVGDVAEAAVEDGSGLALPRLGGTVRLRAGAGEGADHAEGGEVDADRVEAGAAQRLDEGGDHLAPGGDDDDVDLGGAALLGGDAADDLVLEHRLVERHRHLLLGLEADRRLHLLGVLDRRQAHHPDDEALVADPDPHPLGELVLGEERLQRRGEQARIEHLALVEGAGSRAPMAEAVTWAEPLTATSVAAMLPASMSRPTTGPSLGLVRENLGLVRAKEGTPTLHRQRCPEPFALQLPSYRKTWTDLRGPMTGADGDLGIGAQNVLRYQSTI